MVMATRYLHSKLEEQLTCSVCLEQLINPKALPCLHSFCHDCLMKIAKDGKITCPECRKSLEVGEPPDISPLPSNYIVSNILETISCNSQDGEVMKPVVCGNCDNSAKYYCNDCSSPLCCLCYEAHLLSDDTKTHSATPLDDVDASPAAVSAISPVHCSKHDAPLGVFCLSCQEVICEHCSKDSHETHECLPVEDIAEKEKVEIASLLTKMQDRKAKLSKKLSLVRDRDAALVAQRDAVNARIATYFDDVTELLQKHKNKLIEQATTVFSGRRKELVEPEEHLEMMLTRCESVDETMQTVLNAGESVCMLNQKASVMKCLDMCNNVIEEKMTLPDDSVDFITEYSVKEVDEKIFQRCYVFKEVASLETSSASFKTPTEHIVVGKPCIVIVQCKDKTNKTLLVGGQIIKPIITGVQVDNVNVRDNSNGSYDIKFTPQEVGTLNFQVLINGRAAQRCCLNKKVTWTLRENIGTGVLSDGGLTLTGDRAFGSWSYRVGDCGFTSGTHSWKVEIKYSAGQSLFKKEAEVGVVDYDGDLSHSAITHGHTLKWAAKCPAEVVAIVKVDMEQHILSIQFTGGADQAGHSIPPSQFKFNISANKVCPYIALKGKHLSLAVKQSN